MDDGVFGVFDRLVVESGSAFDFVLGHPVLLSRSWQEALRTRHVSTTSQSDLLDRLARATSRIEQNARDYPIGPGPIEQVHGRVQRGELTEGRALELVAEAEIHQLLSPIYVRALSIDAERRARRDDWQTGVALQRLMLAALDARRGKLVIDQPVMEFSAVLHWLDIVTRAVWDVPDGRLFHDALRRGDALASTIDDPGSFYEPAVILQRLGVLHLDPYVSGRSSSNYGRQWRRWQERLETAHETPFEGAAGRDERLPSPEAALPAAVDYFRRAVPHRSGHGRGTTLKALLQALVWQLVVDIVPDPAEVQRAGEEALRLLDRDDDANARLEVASLLKWHASTSNAKAPPAATAQLDVQALLDRPLDDWLASQAPQEVIDLFTRAANTIGDGQPDLALKLWLAVAPLIAAQDDQLKESYYKQGVRVVVDALAPGELPGAGQAIAARAAAIEALGHDAGTTAAMVFALVAKSSENNEEAAALPLLERLAQYDAGFTERFLGLLLWSKAALQVGAAVNARNQGDIEEAVKFEMMGAYTFAATGQPRAAFAHLERALGLAAEEDRPGAIEAFVAIVGDVAPILERELGQRATVYLQASYRRILDEIASAGRPANSALLLLLLEAAKGNLFARAVATGTPLPWLDTAEALQQRKRIADLAPQADAETPRRRAPFDEEELLASYISTGEQQGGDTVSEQFRNLQIAFDAGLNRQLVSREAPEQAWFPTVKTVREGLGPNSVFLSLYVGSLGGSLALYTFFATSEEAGMTIGKSSELPSATITMSDEGTSMSTNMTGLLVAEVRKSIQMEPGERVASAEALQFLEKHTGLLLGGELANHLQRFRRSGKTHICICPHGPFHFYPYHLLGPENEPLAADWAVTYLPNMRLLDPSRRAAGQREELIAFGLDFAAGNPQGLPELSGPEAEAIAIAAVRQAKAVTGVSANRRAVLDALVRYRRIHIASHGEIFVSAPSFQCVDLAADEQGDALYAYEILRLDLRSVDLVTLSACETALGRFDQGDNLRGISANLLIAGVATIVGTLWPIENDACQFFFETFYRCLEGTVTKGEAFHRAQAETRKHHPQYRDWGAFYLSGSIA